VDERSALVFSMTGVTVTTGAARAAARAPATVLLRPSLTTFIRVAKTSLMRFSSAPRSTRWRHPYGIDRLAPVMDGDLIGATARKKCVSKRFGRSTGVIQCA